MALLQLLAVATASAQAQAPSGGDSTAAVVDPPDAVVAGAPAPEAGTELALTERTRKKTRRARAAKRAAASAAPSAPERVAKFPAGWPIGPAPLPGSLLPANRIVAYYGNPYSKRMGILGELPPETMLDHLERTAAKWAAADTATPVKPALHLIVTVAQGKPGSDGRYRMRHTGATIEKVAQWAERKGWLLFLDIQVGQSTVREELPRLLPWLARPYVHLALDPEFAMKDGIVPGRKIGTMDAADVNYASGVLGRLVDSLSLPPKVLVVHRFTESMLTNAPRIRLDPRVQVVIDMDGFGTRTLKRAIYKYVIIEEPVQFTGFKLFTKARNDRPMMTPEEVLRLSPQPLYIQYQ
ncbi:MAG TPA: hypothetical protein VFK09_06990 [Gemmatimonadales bacterium]|nr:hypothetical protein [Gemmatimonadales bacterium]